MWGGGRATPGGGAQPPASAAAARWRAARHGRLPAAAAPVRLAALRLQRRRRAAGAHAPRPRPHPRHPHPHPTPTPPRRSTLALTGSTDPSPVAAGADFVFILTASATGADVSTVTLVVDMPAGVTASAVSPGADCTLDTAADPDSVTCNFASLAAGAPREVRITASAAEPGTYTAGALLVASDRAAIAEPTVVVQVGAASRWGLLFRGARWPAASSAGLHSPLPPAGLHCPAQLAPRPTPPHSSAPPPHPNRRPRRRPPPWRSPRR